MSEQNTRTKMTKPQAQHLAAWIFGPTSFLFLVCVFWFGPKELSPHKHQVLGFFCAIAAGFLGYFIVGLMNVAGTIKLPLIGRIKIRAAGATAMFVLVLLWWQSPRTPFKVEKSVETTEHGVARIERFLLAQKNAKPQAEPSLSDSDRALLARAREQGNLKIRASASVLQPDAQTDALLRELQARHESQEFDLAMLQGKRWYFDNLQQSDKAIPFFERAMVLRGDSFDSRIYAGIAHNSARLGDVNAHQKRAIEIIEGALKLVQPNSVDWAIGQSNLGNMWQSMPTGNRRENLQKAIDADTAALSVLTAATQPFEWAMTQNNLGVSWQSMPTGDRGENLRKAIDAYAAALTVLTKDSYPVHWARTLTNVGNVWCDLPTGDRGENFRRAMDAYTAALTVQTLTAHSIDWATTQNSLGTAWWGMPTGDRGDNLRKAMRAYTAALTVRTKDAYPTDWAATQNNVGVALREMPTGDHGDNLRKAVDACTAALTVYTKDVQPIDWAKAQNNLAGALTELSKLPGENRCERLRRAIECEKSTLCVFTLSAFPREHANTINNLQLQREVYDAAGCAVAMPFDDIPTAK